MVKKTLIVISSFIILVIINFFIIYQLNLYASKKAQINNILTEIENSKTLGNQFNLNSDPITYASYKTNLETGDYRVANLKNFFRYYNSPLYDYSELIVNVSDRYHFDYRLLPAIAMQESNLCRYIPDDSYNCWGWGIYGDKITKFNNYEEAIEIVALGLKKNYLDHGLVTASKIMEKYTPSSNGSWARGVNTFLRLLE